MDQLKDRIKQFIMTEVAPDLGLDDIRDDDALIDSGIIDSLGVLRIMAFLDEEFGVDLGSGEIRLENFKDLDTICRVVEDQAK
jgi:acyl carrier protein